MARTPYEVANQHVEFHPTDSPLRQGSYRALASTANVFARESIRHASFVSPHAAGVIVGLGVEGYVLALSWLSSELSDPADAAL